MTENEALPQGDPRLLQTETAQRLLASTIPARVAYVAEDGTPRLVATWFHWNGQALVMPTFISAPHIKRPAARISMLRARPDVTVSIDTESFPPDVLTVRGRVEITDVDGIAPEYRASAHHFMGDEAATAYLAQIDQPGTHMARIVLRPEWVGLLDFRTRMPGAMHGGG
jgi:hypothetical protein